MKSKNSKPEEIRKSNIQAAKALSDAVRTSLGPRGMDKMIQVTYDLFFA
jgi:T-complex protein 1 subunit delta